MGGDGILLLLLGVLSLRNGGRLSSNGKGFVCYCFSGVTVKEDA